VRMEGLPGQPPDLRQLPTGCSFFPRCAKIIKGTCETVPPPEVAPEEGRRVVCHLFSVKSEGGARVG
jgi:oligopeptide/dipeptide ABC transporter ATP-binding protein